MKANDAAALALLAVTTVLSLVICLSGCTSTTQPQAPSQLASEAQIALTTIETAESIYFLETGASPALQAQATAANNAAQAAITALASAGSGSDVQTDLNAAFTALEAINAAYGQTIGATPSRVTQFGQYLALAQTGVDVALALK